MSPAVLTKPAPRILLLIVVFLVVTGVGASIGAAAAGNPVTGLLAGAVIAGLTLWLYAWLVRRLEQRTPDEVAVGTLRSQVLRGFGTGVAMFTVTITLIAIFGGYRVQGWGSIGAMVGTLGLMIGVATCEEVLFRGVVFRLLEQHTGTAVALGVSGSLFGLLHLINPAATIWGALAIAAQAGLMLGAAYVATRTLWLPIGLHLGWNFAEQGVFGSTVSGSAGGEGGLLAGAARGADAVSGGAFGPEASIFAVLAGLALTVLFLRRARKNGLIVKAPWR